MRSMFFDPQGGFRFLYDDTLAQVGKDLGQISIRRASHVEPDRYGVWWADLGPSKGPTLGPFDTRSEALAAEAKWLNDHAVPIPE